MINLAIIPVRCGSKRLKEKNLLPFNGSNLLKHTIEQAKRSEIFHNIAVSGDHQKYEVEARRAGVGYIHRPDYLANDGAKSIDVVRHVINEIDQSVKFAMMLQVTSPLRSVTDITEAFHAFENSDAKSLISVCEVKVPIQWILTANTKIIDATKVNALHQSTAIKSKFKTFLPNGAIFLSRANDLLKPNSSFYTHNTYLFEMPEIRSVDIDTREDLDRAILLSGNDSTF